MTTLPKSPFSPRRLGEDPFGRREYVKTWITWVITAIVTAGIAALWMWQQGQTVTHWLETQDSKTQADAVIWTCPMHPSVKSNKASVCPVCGMDLVPIRPHSKENDDTAQAAASVALSPSQQVVGHYDTVSPSLPSSTASASLSTSHFIGRLRPAEDKLAVVTSWIPGRIDTLHINQTGQKINKGDALASIYSERLLSAQEEYLVALSAGTLSAALIPATERKLKLLGMSSSEIKRLRERKKTSPRVTIRARESGTALRRLVTEGQYVAEGQVLFEVADLSILWLELDVQLALLSSLNVGQSLTFTVNGSEAQPTHSGQITFIDPFINLSTQTVRVRLVVDNSAGHLQPDMYARAIPPPSSDIKVPRLHLPRSAIIHTGQRDIVWLETAPHTFSPHTVSLGHKLGPTVEIEAGLQVTDQVALHAGFLLDPDSPLPMPDQLRMQAALEDAAIAGHLHVFQPIPNGHFFCPMHPDIHQPNPGRCPRCNMDLLSMSAQMRIRVQAADPLAAVPIGHWYCPMSAEWVQEGSGRCPKCNMLLVQKTDPKVDQAAAIATMSAPMLPPGVPAVIPAGAWYCPMDAEWVQDGPGSCPLCGMTLREQPNPSGEAHPHPHPNHPSAQQDPIAAVPAGKFYCPMGAEWVQDVAGPCPLCGMTLKQQESTQ